MDRTVRQDDPVAYDWLLEEGTAVDQFRVVRPIGRGGMGEVYLARDTQLGRKVALKIIRPDKPLSPEAAHRFLREARATARFNHPHIVTIYAAGEHQGRPYVALEYLEGETLRARFDRRAPGVRETLRIGQAIAEAVREAHAHRILHRDLKPDNVMLGRDGRLRVLDFGVAKALEEEGASVSGIEVVTRFTEAGDGPGACAGTPAYMAPEQWKGDATSGATDIWALGVVLYEALSGQRPCPAQEIPELAAKVCSPHPVPQLSVPDAPVELVQLVQRCLEKDARLRPTAAEAVEVFNRLLAPLPTGGDIETCPFQGLLSFTERHSGLFFGREEEIAVLVERLREEPTLAIVGASGAGKSSFVQAGVIPRLKEESLLVVKLRPGHQPFVSLARRLMTLELRLLGDSGGESDRSPMLADTMPAVRRALDAAPSSGGGARSAVDLDEGSVVAALAEELERSPGTLTIRLLRLAESQRVPVLLFVDQLEELCSLVEADQRRRFMEAICNAADDVELPIRAVFTLREEFLSRLAVGDGVREALGRVTVLRTPGPEVLELILIKQAGSVGYRYDDPDLVRDMVADVLGEPAALSLLQFAGRKLWDARDRSEALLRRATYIEMGGVAGALAQHADGVLAGMTRGEQRLARSLLLRLVTHEGTRRLLTWARLVDGLGDGAEQVLSRLLDARLVTARRAGAALDAPGGEEETNAEVELAHEALAVNWGQLRRWIADSREERQFLAELEQAAQLWERRGCRDDEVWQAGALGDAGHAVQRCTTGVPDQVRRFIDAGHSRQRRRSLRRRSLLGGAFAAVIFVAVGFALKEHETRQQKELAEAQRIEADRRRAEAYTEATRAALARGDLLEARAQLRGALEIQDSTDARLLWWRTTTEPALWRRKLGNSIYAVAHSSDGQHVAVACQDHLVYLLSPITGLIRRVLRGHSDQVFTVAFSRDGKQLASAGWNGEIWLWDPHTGQGRRLCSHGQSVHGLSFSPDGRSLASGGRRGLVRIWDLPGGHQSGVLAGHRGVVYGLGFSPDGKTLASGGMDRALRLWDWRRGRATRVMIGHTDRITAVGFSPDGKLLASASADQSVRLWDAASGRSRGVFTGHGAEVFGVRFGPDGRQVVSASADRTIRVWSVDTLRVTRTVHGGATVYDLDLDPSGQRVVSTTADWTVQMWRIDGPGHTAALPLPEGGLVGLAFHPDGARFAAGAHDGRIFFWDVHSARPTRVLTGHSDPVMTLAFSSDGRWLASGGEDRSVLLWDIATGAQKKQVLAGHSGTVYGAAFSPDGSLLATAARDGTIRLWQVGSGRQIRVIAGFGHEIRNKILNAVDFSPDGALIASAGGDHAARVWDVASGRQRLLLPHAGDTFGVAFDPRSSSRLATTTIGGEVRLWDLVARPPTSVVVGTHPARAYWPSFHPDGQRIGSPGSDGVARIWSIGGGVRELVGHDAEVNTLRFSRDGRLAVTTSDDGTVRVWDAETGQPYWRAPALLAAPPRLLTHHGWLRLDGQSSEARGAARQDAWQAAIERRARLVDASTEAAGRWLCLGSYQDKLELWDTGDDRSLWSRAVPGLTRVVALEGGCVALAAGKAFRFDRSGSRQELVEAEATAASWDGEAILVAAERQVRVFSDAGVQQAVLQADLGVSAIVRDSRWLVLGYRDGNIEVYARGEPDRRMEHSFEEIVASPVKAMRIGRHDTLVAGFGNGLFGIWNLHTGKRLSHARLHGPAIHLLLSDTSLHAGTELGDHRSWDLAPLFAGHCKLLCEVWQQVPVVWDRGLPVVREPPRDHRCSSHCR